VNPEGDQFEALSVRLIGPVPQPPQDVYADVYQTVILSPAATIGVGGAEEILPASSLRVVAMIQPLDDDIVVSDNMSDANSGRGATIPKTNTAPWPIQGSGAVYAWVAGNMAGAQSRISVSAVYRVRQ
jgi:hypothetical protein